jgi:hypothetical protein
LVEFGGVIFVKSGSSVNQLSDLPGLVWETGLPTSLGSFQAQALVLSAAGINIFSALPW